MMKTMFKMTMGLGIMALAASQVSAQQARNCAPRDVVVERLASGYGETRQSVGLGANNAMVEVFASDDVRGRGLVTEVPDPVHGSLRLVRSPLRFSDTDVRTPSAPPRLGAQTQDVLDWLRDQAG